MLGSGSRGNGTLIESGGTRLLLDCGFGLRDTVSRLERAGVEPAAIDAILVTHEHGDHLGGVSKLARRYQIPVYLTAGTESVWNDPKVPERHRISPHQGFRIGAIDVRPYPVPHDAREPCQFVFECNGLRLGIVSDAGHVTTHMLEQLSACDALMLECNHEPELLAQGPYPPSLKRRVGGQYGHLANAQAAQLLRQVDRSRLRQLTLTHLSETNNTPEHALAAVCDVLETRPDWVQCAHQEQGLDWQILE